MKVFAIQALLVATVVSTSLTSRSPIFVMPITGWTDLDFIDYAEGFGTGVFNKDVRGQFDECLNGVPLIGEEVYNTYLQLDINFANPFAIFKNFGKKILLLVKIKSGWLL